MGFSNGLYCCYGFLLRQKDHSFDIIISVLPWLRHVIIVVWVEEETREIAISGCCSFWRPIHYSINKVEIKIRHLKSYKNMLTVQSQTTTENRTFKREKRFS